jgi:hypothetical protein
MLYSSLIVLSVSLLPFAAAQDSAVGIPAIEAHFAGAGIVPSAIPTFEPTALLSINYDGVGDLTPGQLLKKEQVGPVPTLTVTPGDSSTTLDGNFTVAMVDVGTVGSDQGQGVTRHWLINGATIGDNKVSNATANAVANYAGPWPAAGSGPHRYVVLLFSEPTDFTAPQDSKPPTEVVNNWDMNKYIKDSKMGPIVAANYIQVEEGQATASFAPTSSVVSSTLAPASGSGKPTGSGSSSGSAPSASPTGAGVAKSVSLGAAVVAAFFVTLGSAW